MAGNFQLFAHHRGCSTRARTACGSKRCRTRGCASRCRFWRDCRIRAVATLPLARGSSGSARCSPPGRLLRAGRRRLAGDERRRAPRPDNVPFTFVRRTLGGCSSAGGVTSPRARPTPGSGRGAPRPAHPIAGLADVAAAAGPAAPTQASSHGPSSPHVRASCRCTWKRPTWRRAAAIRRALFRAMPNDTILDDVLIPMRIVQQGYIVQFEQEARAYRRCSRTTRQEYVRKVRTIAGAFQLFAREWWLLDPRKNASGSRPCRTRGCACCCRSSTWHVCRHLRAVADTVLRAPCWGCRSRSTAPRSRGRDPACGAAADLHQRAVRDVLHAVGDGGGLPPVRPRDRQHATWGAGAAAFDQRAGRCRASRHRS